MSSLWIGIVSFSQLNLSRALINITELNKDSKNDTYSSTEECRGRKGGLLEVEILEMNNNTVSFPLR